MSKIAPPPHVIAGPKPEPQAKLPRQTVRMPPRGASPSSLSAAARCLGLVIAVSTRALRRNLMRSTMTCLGIVIGIAAVIAMMEIGEGSAVAIHDRIATLGANVLQVEPGAASSSGVGMGAGTNMSLTPADCEAIARECHAVTRVAPGVDCRVQLVAGNRNWVPWRVLGTTSEYLGIRDWSLEEGNVLSDSDVRNVANVCVLGQTPAQALFPDESPIGKEVRVRGVNLKVIGLLARKGASMMGMDQDDIMIAPWTTVKFRINSAKYALSDVTAALGSAAKSQVNSLSNLYPTQQTQLYPARSVAQTADSPQPVRFADIDDIFLSVNSAEEIPETIEAITELLRRRHNLHEGQADDFAVHDWTEFYKMLSSTSHLMTNLLLCIAPISLLVGGIGIMNMMLVSVTERTREIGIRRAMGARGIDIRRQFLAEAVMLCLCGGLAGILVGRGSSFLLSAVLGWPTIASVSAVLISVAVATSVGIIFGYYPAWKASRLDPIEALRYE
jgi:ABC-type antimicrobial peptide transport system permease subunit